MASKPCAFTNQGLQEHVDGVVRVAEAFIEATHLDRTIAKRLKALGVDATPQVVKDYMVLAAASHDLGKALKMYQDQFDNSCNLLRGEGPSFRNHEVYSAAIMMLKGNEIKSRYGDCEECLYLAIMAVLWHHHAMRVHLLDRKELAKLHDEIRIGGEFVGAIRLPKGIVVANLRGDDVMNGLRNLYSWANSQTGHTIDGVIKKTKALLSAFSLPLIIADYKDSSKRVNSNKGDFAYIVEDLLKAWGVSV